MKRETLFLVKIIAMNYYHPSVFEIRLNFIKNKKNEQKNAIFLDQIQIS